MKKTPLLIKSGLSALTLTTFFCVSPSAYAQSAPAQDRPSQDARPAQDRDDINRGELASFDSFLDKHREISEQLRKNPSLVDDKQFVDNHPALRDYLADHPRVREQLRQDPNAFMHAENRFDRREDGRDRGGNLPRNNPNISRDELQSFSTFLDNHRRLADELRKNPSLVNDKQYVQNHPELQTYLTYHTSVSAELTAHPDAFMRDESTFNRGDGDTTRRELASYDRFLDAHKEIAEQLRKNPYLVDNQEFIKNHPALQTYLQQHPAVQQEIHENPTAFLEAEHRYDTHEDALQQNRRPGDMDRDDMHRHFGEFLGGHSELAQQLSKDPSQVKNEEFLKNHPELNDYLKAHPQDREAMMANPQGFMKACEPFTNNSNNQTTKTPAPKPKPNQ